MGNGGSQWLDGLFKAHTDTRWWILDLNGAGKTPRLVSVNTVLVRPLFVVQLFAIRWVKRKIYLRLGKGCFQNIPQGTYCLVMNSLSGEIIANIYWAFATCRALPAKALDVLAHSYTKQLSSSLAHSHLRAFPLVAYSSVPFGNSPPLLPH